MAKGWWFNLVLLVLVAAGGGGLWYADQQDTARKKEEEAGRKISDWTVASVQKLVYQGGDKVTLAMEKKGEGWVMTQPAGALVDTRAVANLLSILEALYERKAADSPGDLAAFGLDKPNAVLTVNGEGEKTLTLKAGTSSPASGHRYVQIGEKGPVVMVTSDKAGSLMQDSKALRNRSLFAQMDIGKVKKVELQRPDYAMSFAKGGEEKWRLQTPVADRAHPQRFSSWLEMLLMANATGFKAATPPAKPDWQIILNGGEAEGQKVVLWKDKEDILASRQGEPDAMVLPKYLAKDLDKSGLEMVDLRMLEGGSLSRLQATWQGKTVSVEKKENNWPLPAWNSVEESLTRDGVEAMMGVGEPASVELVLEAVAGDGKWQIKGWKEGKDMVLAVPDRPVRIRLSTLQTEALEKSLQVIFAPPEEKKADKGVVEK